MRHTRRALFPLLALLACAPLSARAQQEGDVAVGGELLFTIKATVEGVTPAKRAEEVTGRLPDILGDYNIDPLDIVVAGLTEKSRKIMVKNKLLVTVLPEDGKVNGLSAAEQAEIWADQIRRALPEVNAKPNPNVIGKAPQQVTGTVFYLQRIALPPTASLIVRLLDVTTPAAPAVVSSRIYRNAGQVPIKFALPYTLSGINTARAYAVDAEIRVDGQVRWRPASATKVITRGASRTVNIRLNPVTPPRP